MMLFKICIIASLITFTYCLFADKYLFCIFILLEVICLELGEIMYKLSNSELEESILKFLRK